MLQPRSPYIGDLGKRHRAPCLLSLVLMNLCLSAGCSDSLPAEQADADRAVHQVVREFGARIANAGDQIVLQIPVENPSTDQPLLTTLKSRSCNCAEAWIEPSEIPPAGTGVLKVFTNVGNVPEPRQLTLGFSTSLPVPSALQFVMHFEVYPRIEFSPPKLPIQNLGVGESSEIEFVVRHYQPPDEAAERLTIQSSVDWLKIDTVSDETLLRPEVRVSTLHCQAHIQGFELVESEPVVHSATILARTARSSADTPLLCRVTNPITSQPPALIVRPVDDETFESKIRLTSDVAFRILSVEGSQDGLGGEFGTPGTSAKNHVGRVYFGADDPGPADAVPQRLCVTVRTDHPRQSSVEIPVYLYR